MYVETSVLQSLRIEHGFMRLQLYCYFQRQSDVLCGGEVANKIILD